MKAKEYKDLCGKTLSRKNPEDDQDHMLMGIFTELGEILDIYKKNICRDVPKPVDLVHLKEEIGDVAFYSYNLCSMLGVDLEIEEGLPTVKSDKDVRDSLLATIGCYGLVYSGHIPLSRFPALVLSTCGKIAEYYGFTLEDSYKANIDKLHKVRYKDGYSDGAHDSRDLEKEYKTLNSEKTTEQGEV